jgi:hypothetical protein
VEWRPVECCGQGWKGEEGTAEFYEGTKVCDSSLFLPFDDLVILIHFYSPFRQSDPRQAHYANEAREFLRKKLIGKHVKVAVDFIRPKEGEFDERECATVRYASHNT